MQIIKSVTEMQNISQKLNGKIGFVPTMGFLHEGHLSLVKEAHKKCDFVIVSIFVNPSQFLPNEDLDSYPRNFEQDVKLLSDIDFIFFPQNEDIYPNDYKTWITVEKISAEFCGKSRPTHFKGVATIVCKLLNIVNADFLFLGEKDFQQLVVLKQMTKDLNFKTEVIGCPIVREKSGLALSSRNKYLSEIERKNALSLFEALQLAKINFKNGIVDSQKNISQMQRLIEEKGGVVDYIEIIDSQNLEKISKLKERCRVLIAVFIDKTRLIDNIEI
ncbi:MAG: pantoate--beta-alanine ligase [Candidatus Cloacimonetes bacterium]|jgi:pantoate--beta-alanine ligase|nr:pantoate--beta-alanine ligase [Candidatus Cloacimonadota bacterium]MBT6994023.1 pantoate--beta-alanine ligase [Candidatus Cloacimonadota bacterium]